MMYFVQPCFPAWLYNLNSLCPVLDLIIIGRLKRKHTDQSTLKFIEEQCNANHICFSFCLLIEELDIQIILFKLSILSPISWLAHSHAIANDSYFGTFICGDSILALYQLRTLNYTFSNWVIKLIPQLTNINKL